MGVFGAIFWLRDKQVNLKFAKFELAIEGLIKENYQLKKYNGRAGAIAAKPQYALRRCALRAIRSIYKDREAAINSERDAFRKDFLSKHNIIIYQI